MKIKVTRINDAFHFIAENETGNTLSLDGGPEIGGNNTGMRPIELLPAALAGCSGFDIVSILKKQKQIIRDFQILVDAERETGRPPAIFTTIHVSFNFRGDLDREKVKKAVDLSMEKYCSVSRILEKSAKITYSITVNSK